MATIDDVFNFLKATRPSLVPGSTYSTTDERFTRLNDEKLYRIAEIELPAIKAQLARIEAALAPPTPSRPAALSKPFYVQADTEAGIWCNRNPGDSRRTAIAEKITRVPQGIWAGPGDVSWLKGGFDDAAAKGRTMVLVAYAIPHRDAGGWASGGAASDAEYRDWTDRTAKVIGDHPVVIILEPDSIIHMVGSNSQFRTARCALLKYAVDKYKAACPNALVYLDGGDGWWNGADEIADLLIASGVANARGVAVNVSNYNDLGASYTRVIDPLLRELAAQGAGDKRFVFDTSRNGNGPAADRAWCNPGGRALGEEPNATRVGEGWHGQDAVLWIKRPGESDGSCGAYPNVSSGAFSPQIAYDLCVN